MRGALPWLAVFLSGVLPMLVGAEEITIHVEAADKRPVRAEADFPALKKARPTLTVGLSDPVTVKWTVRGTEPAKTLKDVLVHFFVVRIEKPNQAEVPPLTRNVVAESALTMDFRPGEKAEGDLTFSIPRPGWYLLRVEIKGLENKERGEPVAALDILAR